VSKSGYTGEVKATTAVQERGSAWSRKSRNRFSRYRETLSGLDSAQKPGNGVPAYTRWVNRRLGRYAAAAAHVFHWTPNAVTALSATFSLAAITLLVLVDPQPWLGIAVAVLLATGYLLDSADGQVARLQRAGSPAGEWLDHVVDALRTPAIHLAVLVGLWNQDQPSWLLAVALGYCLVSVVEFMSQILAEQLVKQHPAPAPTVPTPTTGTARSFLLLPTDNGTFCWIFLGWGFPPLFMVVYTTMFATNLIHTLISMRRKYVKLRQVGQTPPAVGHISPRTAP
jgi:phosphatidylglycerophosphate synthase